MHDADGHRLHVRKEALKFAAAHMTIFSASEKERLHGHNYTTELTVDVGSSALGAFVSFASLKDALRALCEAWDEKVLLPGACPHLTFTRHDDEEVELVACGRRYVFPAEEVEILPVDNVITEALAETLGRALVDGLPDAVRANVRRLALRVDESPGQGATWTWTATNEKATDEEAAG